MSSAAYRTLHSLENDGITPQLFSVLAKERKGNDMTSAPISIPPTLVFERGFVKFMFQTEISRIDGDRTVPVETDSLPKRFLNMHTALEHGYRLELKKKLGRDVIIKEVYEEFIADTKETDIVACLMMCQYKDRDDYSSFKYLDREALYKFLMQTVDRPRAMLQKFVQPKGSNNTMIFAVWSPLVLVAEGRRSVHSLNETAVSVDNRGVTFETDDVRLIRDLALPKSVIDELTTTCLTIKSHVEAAERGLSLTRLACYFKIDQYSTLHLIAATSIRLQKTSKTEFRHPLDLNCGAASPFADREAEAAKIERDLEECERKQHSLRMQLSKGIPSSTGMSLIAEARKRASSVNNNTSQSSFNSSSSPSKNRQKLIKSGAVLPNGDVYPSAPNAEELYGPAAMRSSSSSSATPQKMRGVFTHNNNNNSSTTPSWQRHRGHIQNSNARSHSSTGGASTPQPQKQSKNVDQNVDKTIQSLFSKHSQHHNNQINKKETTKEELKATTTTPTPKPSEEKRQQQNTNRPTSPSAAVSFSPETTAKGPSKTPSSHFQNRFMSAGGGASNTIRSRSAGGGGGGSGYYGSNFQRSRGKNQQVNVGSSIESGIVLDALSSLPKSNSAQPFSTVFSRRIVQEERVSNSWNAFLQRQKKELSSILQNSPVVISAGGGGKNNRGEFHAGTNYDQTGGNHHLLAQQHQNTSSYASFASTSTNPYLQQQASRPIDPYPVGDMSVDFDNVTKRSLRQRSGGGRTTTSPAGDILQRTSSHHNQQGSADYSSHSNNNTSSMAGNYAKSLRQAQVAYMSPGGLNNYYQNQQQQQNQMSSPQRRQSVMGGGRQSRSGSTFMNNNNDQTHQNTNETTTRKNALALPQDKPIEAEEVPQLIDPSLLPKMKSKEGNQGDSSVAFPNSVPKQVSTSTAIPSVFGAPRPENTDASQKNFNNNRNSPDRPPSSPSLSSKKNLTRYQQEQQRRAEAEYNEQQKQQQMLLDAAIVHEATPKFWHLRSAHPEVTSEEFKRLKSHVPPLQDKAVEQMFEYVRHVVHGIRRECRRMIQTGMMKQIYLQQNNNDVTNESMNDTTTENNNTSTTSQQQQDKEEIEKSSRPIYFEIPHDMLRTSITLDDIAAMFQPLHCRVVSRGEGLKMLEQAASNKKLSLSKTSWKELSDRRAEALSRIDETFYRRWYEFPGQSPATESFFSTAGTALIILPPSPEEMQQQVSVAASMTPNSKSNLVVHGNNNKFLAIDVLDEDNQEADSSCGLDYLLNAENGAVAYVCMKSLPMAKPDGRGGIVNNLPF